MLPAKNYIYIEISYHLPKTRLAAVTVILKGCVLYNVFWSYDWNLGGYCFLGLVGIASWANTCYLQFSCGYSYLKFPEIPVIKFFIPHPQAAKCSHTIRPWSKAKVLKLHWMRRHGSVFADLAFTLGLNHSMYKCRLGRSWSGLQCPETVFHQFSLFHLHNRIMSFLGAVVHEWI